MVASVIQPCSQQSATVIVAKLGGGAPWCRIGRHKVRHPVESLVEARAEGLTTLLHQRIGPQEHLHHHPMVAR